MGDRRYALIGHTHDGAGGGAAVWGDITGTLSNQTDLQAVLDTKLESSDLSGYLQASDNADITGSWTFSGANEARFLSDKTHVDLPARPSSSFNWGGGLEIWDSDNTVKMAAIDFVNAPDLSLTSYVHGATVNLRGEDAGGVMRNLASLDPDGNMYFYVNGTRSFGSRTAGVLNAWSTSAGRGKVAILSDSNASMFEFGFESGATDVVIGNNVDGGRMLYNCENSSGVTTQLMNLDPDLYVGLGLGNVDVDVRGGSSLRVFDSGNTDYAEMSHDGTDFTIAGTNTTDLNITGITALNAGNYSFDVDQTVGASQDNYVLTYDNAAGLIRLEAAASGGSGGTYSILKCKGDIQGVSFDDVENNIDFNSPVFNTGSDVSHDPTASDAAEFRIENSGTYKFTVTLMTDNANRTELFIRTYIDTGSGYVQDTDEIVSNYVARDTDQNTGAVTLVTALALTANDLIQFRGFGDTDGTSTGLDAGTVILIERVA